MFCNVFVRNRLNLMLLRKNWLHQNLSSELTKRLILIKHMKLDRYCRKLFFISKWTKYSTSKHFEGFSLEIDQNPSFQSKKGQSQNETWNYMGRTFYFQMSVKRVISSGKLFRISKSATSNRSLLFLYLHLFRWKSQKTTVIAKRCVSQKYAQIWQKWLIFIIHVNQDKY